MSANEPAALPHCKYPSCEDVARHGVQPLPRDLPLVDFAKAAPYRSRRIQTRALDRLTSAQTLAVAEVVGRAFAQREPQTRHLRPPRSAPPGLSAATHRDPFGADAFGGWTKERLLYWFIRLLVLTNPASPSHAIELRGESLAQSLAILDADGGVLGGALNETMPSPETATLPRRGDPFLDAVLTFISPILTLLATQDAEALAALSSKYPAFRSALAAGRVGHHFMVARSDRLPKADTFELVAATAEHYQRLSYAFMTIEATNPWTGAACEALGGVPVHFAPFQRRFAVQQSDEPLDGVTTSANGWLSDRDSGSMLYVVRLG